MRIKFDYSWYDDEKRVMRYAARDNWTWRDYHAAVHASLFAIQTQPHEVHSIVDFTTTQEGRFPSGIAAHARTFGKLLAPNLSGKAIAVGVPPNDLAKLNIETTRRLPTRDGEVHFVENLEEVEAILRSWLAET